MDGEHILRGFHARHPGATSQIMGSARATGPSGYELLVRAVEVPAGATILDLACGDGYLLELLARARPDARLVGVDLSEAELAAARRRLGPAVELRRESAEALGLRDGSVDQVVCHMALMLMSPIAPVLDRIARVLVPGGRFAALVNASTQPGAAWSLFGEVYRAILAESGAAPIPDFGDPRTEAAAPFEALIAGHGAFRDVRVTPAVVTLDGTPEQVAELLDLTYPAFALGDARAELDRALRERLPSLRDERGLVPLPMDVLLLRATRT